MKIRVLFLSILFIILAFVCLYPDDTFEYRQRGSYKEGILPKPISGYDIELISVLVDYKGRSDEISSKKISEDLKVRFYLQNNDPAFITVREVNYSKFYWLDSINPETPWKAGTYNEFMWPTANIIAPLKIDINTLGILIRLKKNHPSSDETIAPAVFYHTNRPEKVTGYIFHLKTAEDSIIKWMIYNSQQKAPLEEARLNPTGGIPFSIIWNASEMQKGNYKLVIKGYIEDTNDPISLVVNFYHNPEVM